ncbi:MAG: tetratricopeptide repeat protein [Flavobacteriales bacterium]
MNEEAAKRDDHQPARELQQRYEAMLKARQSWYFDIDQFEQIVDLYFDQGRVRKALSVIHYARTIFPDAFVLRLRQAQLLAGMGELNRALGLLRALEEVEPTNDEVLLTLGTVFSQLRDHRNAVRYYERALRFGQVELQDEVYIDLALEYENMERFNEAIRVLDRALRQNPENDTAVYEIAYCFEMAGRFEDARAYYVQFLDEHPYSFATWYNLGNSYFRTAEYPKAADAFEYCLAIEDQFAPGWYNLANTLVYLEDFNRAIECYKETMELETPQAGVYCLVGECYEKLEQLKEADFYYNLALKLDPKNVDAIIGKAVVNDLQGHSEKAIELLREADGLEPNNPDIMLMMAEAQKNVGNVSSAREIYLRAIEAHPKCVQAWLDYAHFRFDLNHVDGAENLIEQALGENPDNTSLLLRKVAYLHALGKQKQALLLLDYLHQSENNDFDELTDYYPEILNDADARELCKSPEES